MDDLAFGAERNSKPFSKKTRQEFNDNLKPVEPLTFYAIFNSYCQPNRLLIQESKQDDSTPASQVNFFRGILSQFQV